MTSSYEYLVKKYKEMGLMKEEDNKDNNKDNKNSMRWDPFIYPNSGYIPPCNVCKGIYDDYVLTSTINKDSKQETITWPHYVCGCLWSDYYQDKILKVNPNVNFIKNK